MSPQGGPFSVTFGNKSQTFNSSSGAEPPSCGPGSVTTKTRIPFREFSVDVSGGDDTQLVTIRNEGGNFSFIDVTSASQLLLQVPR
jgi:hypothetical protein